MPGTCDRKEDYFIVERRKKKRQKNRIIQIRGKEIIFKYIYSERFSTKK